MTSFIDLFEEDPEEATVGAPEETQDERYVGFGGILRMLVLLISGSIKLTSSHFNSISSHSYDDLFAKVASLSFRIMNAGGLWMELLFGV